MMRYHTLARTTGSLLIVLMMAQTPFAGEAPGQVTAPSEGAALVSLSGTGLTLHDVENLKAMANLENLHLISPWAGTATVNDIKLRHPVFKALFYASPPVSHPSVEAVGDLDCVRRGISKGKCLCANVQYAACNGQIAVYGNRPCQVMYHR